eukprot:TRINITY_DN328_c0_g1_i1.p1 TRINITY_DN328_c0_g1~~TRINITY_DN328_c0_g1_i1.p1  ORF type:complete len:434 (-),score=122.87 TRINITY_DN328_c0_g1_i1:627-1928(-)
MGHSYVLNVLGSTEVWEFISGKQFGFVFSFFFFFFFSFLSLSFSNLDLMDQFLDVNSFVRSVTMDDWNDKQLALMSAGGNARMKTFFADQNYPDGLSLKDKYSCEASQSYRDWLKKVAAGEQASPVPFIGYSGPRSVSKVPVGALGSGGSGYGNSIIPSDENASSFNSSASGAPGGPKKYSGFGNTDYQPPAKSNTDDFWGGLSSTLSYVSEKSGQALNVVAQKSSETVSSLQTADLGTKISAVGSSGLATAKDLGAKGWSAFSAFYESTVQTTSSLWGESTATPPPYPVEEQHTPNLISRDLSAEKDGNGWGFESSSESRVGRSASSKELKTVVSSEPKSTDPFEAWGFSDEVTSRPVALPESTSVKSSDSALETKRSIAAPGKTISSRKVIIKTAGQTSSTLTDTPPSKPIASNNASKADVDPFDEDWGWN